MTSLETEIQSRGYAHPEKLVSTAWVAENLDAPNVRIVESNEDVLLYFSGHIPGAVEIDWTRDLNDPIRRDYLQKEAFEKLVQKHGITQDTTVIFYGDKSNWWATYALWVFSLFGYNNTKIMDGGRMKWEKEGRILTREVPKFEATQATAPTRNDQTDRVYRDGVMEHIEKSGKLIDVRSPLEFSGEKLHMEGYPNEGALRGGHIPGAKSVPWAKAIEAETGCYLNADSLKELYENQAGLTKEDEQVVVYCRIGERSSHTWFALKFLLGYPNVRNYDGSWTEWGNLVGVPVER